jgi:DNA-binding response OmpR family regulator
MRILIAEDDRALSSFLRKSLCGEGDEAEITHDGEAALASFFQREPDLLILDLDLPRLSGTEVLLAVRQASALCPVLVLSGRADGETRIACLDMGADDCLQKPFSLGELRARCRAMLRRQGASRELLNQANASVPAADAPSLTCGALEMVRARRLVEIAGVPVSLTNREFSLLEQLLLANGATVSRVALREAVWDGKPVETNIVDVHLAALRRKLGLSSFAPVIETVRGVGFRLANLPDLNNLPPQVFAPSASRNAYAHA